jgi:hypothetical protein
VLRSAALRLHYLSYYVWPAFNFTIAGLVGHQVLGLLECIKAKLLAEGGQLVPGCATVYAMGIEVVTPSTLQLQQQAGSWQQHGTDTTSSSGSSSSREQRTEVPDLQQGDVALDLSTLKQFR